eukprot:SAG31_NODE_4944_length_2844_cov_1.437887_1_plen_116_part_00
MHRLEPRYRDVCRILAELLGGSAVDDKWEAAMLPENAAGDNPGASTFPAGPAAAAKAVESALIDKYRQQLPSPLKERLSSTLFAKARGDRSVETFVENEVGQWLRRQDSPRRKHL